MKQGRNRTLLLGLLSGVVGVAGLIWTMLRRRSSPVPVIPQEQEPVQVVIPEAAPAPALPQAVPQPTLLRLISAGGGLACLIAFQWLLLRSRQPVLPVMLFGLGVVLLQPLYAYFESRWLAEPPELWPARVSPPGVRNRALYWAAGCFFGLIAALLTVGGVPGSLRILSWLLAVFALSWAVLNGERFCPVAWPPRYEMAIVIALGLGAVLLQIFTPSFENGLNLILVPAAVVVVYLLGRTWDGPALGLTAAALATVSGWLLALGKTTTWEIALASLGALYVLSLLHLPRRKAMIGAALALGLGTLINPAFVLAGALLPVYTVLAWLDNRHARWQHLRDTLVIVLLALVVMLPGLQDLNRFIESLAPPVVVLEEDEVPPPANPQLSPFEGLSTSLLMFNLASDPNVLHGIVWRPTFGPLSAAALIAGVMGNTWLLYVRRRWRDALLLAALVCLLLPAAVNPMLPVRYPDLQRAAGALPLALILAAYGLMLIGRLAVIRLGRAGLILVLLLLGIGLALTLLDWQNHYREVFLPLLF
ncbi:MAG: hypothetical protein K8L99_04155 [Anaerolineae bacterium]|nr:hypothetical protein [Anaerolineae bacterium]